MQAKIILESETFPKSIEYVKIYFDINEVYNNTFCNSGIEGKIYLKMGKTLIVEAD